MNKEKLKMGNRDWRKRFKSSAVWLINKSYLGAKREAKLNTKSQFWSWVISVSCRCSKSKVQDRVLNGMYNFFYLIFIYFLLNQYYKWIMPCTSSRHWLARHWKNVVSCLVLKWGGQKVKVKWPICSLSILTSYNIFDKKCFTNQAIKAAATFTPTLPTKKANVFLIYVFISSQSASDMCLNMRLILTTVD